MKFLRVYLVILSIAASPNCVAAEGTSLAKGINLLKHLAYQLRMSYMAPQGEDYGFMCPEKPERLMGISKTSVESVLGKPNFASHRASVGTWTYYFSSTPPNNWQPRYPRITFYFGSNEQVKRVSCFDLH
jgi:hypothetical protein